MDINPYKDFPWWMWLLAIPWVLYLLPVAFIARAFGDQAEGWFDQQVRDGGPLHRWWWSAVVHIAAGAVWALIVWAVWRMAK